jgi:hypothetical protein
LGLYWRQRRAFVDEIQTSISLWDFIPVDQDSYYIKHGDSYLSVSTTEDNHSLLLLSVIEDDKCSKWKLQLVDSEYYLITSVKNERAIDLVSGCQLADVVSLPLHKDHNQQWKVIPSHMISEFTNRLSPIQRLYNSFNEFRSRHRQEELDIGLFNIIVNHGDIFAKILSRLSMKELARLRQLCKHMKEFLPTYHKKDYVNINIRGEYNDVDRIFLKGPVITRYLHRVYIYLDWSDQGWGNLKTRLMFYLKRNGSIIAQWGIRAFHNRQEYNLLLEDYNILGLSQPNDVIEVWRHVGGGGGHVMYITKMSVIFEVLA